MKPHPLLCFFLLTLSMGVEAARPGTERELDWRRLQDNHLQQELNKIYGGPRWLDDMVQARKVALLQRNNLLVLFSRRGDENSAALKRDTLGEQSVWKSLGAYTLLELDVDFHFEPAFDYQVRSVPTMIWMTPEGRELHRVVGNVSAEDLKAFIERIQNPQSVLLPPEQAGLIKQFRENRETGLMADILQNFQGEAGKVLKEAVRELDPPPVEVWVNLLSHPILSVRLASLEFLEERAGTSFDFDPWADPAGQVTALSAWKAWADEVDEKNIPRYIPLTVEQLAGRVRDLDSASDAHVLRAIQTLETAGPDILPRLEVLREKSDLTKQQLRKLDDVLLSLRLADLGWPDAAGAAFRLQRGPINTRMKLIQKLGSGGSKALPVLNVFLEDPEVLIRESVMESLLQAGGVQALPLVLSRMETEPSTDIALAVMRRLAKMSNKEATAWLKTQLLSGQEERMLGALEAMQSGKHDALAPEILTLLDDPRWRIRATAATTLGAIHYTEALKVLLEHRHDPDDFARLAILDASLDMMGNKKKKAELIATWFEENAADASVVIGLACQKGLDLPANLITATLEMQKAQQLNLLQIFLECGDTGVPIALKLAGEKDDDLRVSALRILARYGLMSEDARQKNQAERLLVKALQSEPDEVIEVLLINMEMKKAPFSSAFRMSSLSAALPEEGEVADLLSAFGDEPAAAPANEEESEHLDDLLSAFADPEEKEPESAPSESLEAILKKLFSETEHEGVKNSASLLLIEKGDEEALAHVLTVLSEIDKDLLRRTMYRHNKDRVGLEIALALRNGSQNELRGDALSFLTRNATVDYFLPRLDKMGEENSELTLPELKEQLSNFGYVFREVKSFEMNPYLQKWFTVKKAESQEDIVRKFAGLQLALSSKNKQQLSKIRSIAETHADPDLRAFAWITLGGLQRRLIEEDLEKISSDSSSRVRMVLPFLYMRGDDKTWQVAPRLHPEYTLDGYDVGNAWSLFMREKEEAAIGQMMQEENSDILLLSGLALFSQRKENPHSERWHRSLQRAQPEHWITETASEILYDNYQASRDPDGVIYNWLMKMYGESYRTEQLQKKRGTRSSVSTTATKDAEPPLIEPKSTDGYQAPVVVYIYSESCGDCDTVRLYLENHTEQYPDLNIQAVQLEDPGARDLYRALFRRYDLPLTGVGLTPMLAGANDIASGSDDLTYERVGEIIASSMDGSGFSWIPAVAPEPVTDPESPERVTSLDSIPPPSLTETRTPVEILHHHGVLVLLAPFMVLMLLLLPKGHGLLVRSLAMAVGALLSFVPFPSVDFDRILIGLIALLFPLWMLYHRSGPGPVSVSLSEEIPSPARKKRRRDKGVLTGALLLFLLGWALPWPGLSTSLTLTSSTEKGAAGLLLVLLGVVTVLRYRKGRIFLSCVVSLLLFRSLLG